MTPKFAIYILWAFWLFVWWSLALWGASLKPEKHLGWKREIVFRVMMFAGYVLLFALYGNAYDLRYSLWRTPPSTIGWLLVILALAGFGIALWARIVMGRLWSGSIVRKTDQRIIDAGPYAFVRHPIYAGIIIAVLATTALFGIPSSVLGAVLIVAAAVLKAHIEENFLLDEMNGAYDDYIERTPMFLPGLYRLRDRINRLRGQSPRDDESLPG
jgi:protein-S-isoprenylcysteine O-methyltransferase Ste14